MKKNDMLKSFINEKGSLLFVIKKITTILVLIVCFSCKNDNSEVDNTNSSSTQIKKNEPELIENWDDSLISSESNQNIAIENTSEEEYIEENIAKCNECNTELITPSNRACYICNRNFSGWGFIIRHDDIDNEQMESIINCFPELNIHNSASWGIYEEACCSRRCAKELY
jgi:hypothetical protein